MSESIIETAKRHVWFSWKLRGFLDEAGKKWATGAWDYQKYCKYIGLLLDQDELIREKHLMGDYDRRIILATPRLTN